MPSSSPSACSAADSCPQLGRVLPQSGFSFQDHGYPQTPKAQSLNQLLARLHETFRDAPSSHLSLAERAQLLTQLTAPAQPSTSAFFYTSKQGDAASQTMCSPGITSTACNRLPVSSVGALDSTLNLTIVIHNPVNLIQQLRDNLALMMERPGYVRALCTSLHLLGQAGHVTESKVSPQRSMTALWTSQALLLTTRSISLPSLHNARSVCRSEFLTP